MNRKSKKKKKKNYKMEVHLAGHSNVYMKIIYIKTKEKTNQFELKQKYKYEGPTVYLQISNF